MVRKASGQEAEHPGGHQVICKLPSLSGHLGWIISLVTIKGLSAKLNIECQFSVCSMADHDNIESVTQASNIIKLNAEIRKK